MRAQVSISDDSEARDDGHESSEDDQYEDDFLEHLLVNSAREPNPSPPTQKERRYQEKRGTYNVPRDQPIQSIHWNSDDVEG